MACKKKNCCRAVRAELHTKATAELQSKVEEELSNEDGSIAKLLEEQEEENEDKDTEDQPERS